MIEANKAREAEKGIDIGSFGWAMQVYSTSTLDFFGESKQIAFGSKVYIIVLTCKADLRREMYWKSC